MKSYEAVTRSVLPRRTYTLCRVDGRSFHSFLRHADRPFDDAVMAAMDAVAEALCSEMSGAVFAFTQSDECSVAECCERNSDVPAISRRFVARKSARHWPRSPTPRRRTQVAEIKSEDVRIHTLTVPEDELAAWRRAAEIARGRDVGPQPGDEEIWAKLARLGLGNLRGRD
ncbi:tRNA(His) guanylyltransferase Thg1 family protein [Spirillospora sp. NPDC048911]|uniref:tRNA(His) guanylyltransferase Thg1 family protein n=1 Tax=Spirillospora sp. NPDC048911 TaxID=3364527 RepID=UPI003721E080